MLEITGGSPVIENLTILSSGKEMSPIPSFSEEMSSECVLISGGTPKFVQCVITSQNGAGMRISGKDASPEVSRCVFQNNANSGVILQENASGRFHGC